MKKSVPDQGFAPYMTIFPKARRGFEELKLLEKTGKAKPGIYLFVETYCVIEGCDCRQVVIQVINDKQRTVAVIDFSLDINCPSAKLGLNGSVKQSVAAEGLLEIFAECISESPEWYRGMCQRYRAVRKKVDGVPYRGERFPSKNNLKYLSVFSEGGSEELLEDLEWPLTFEDNRRGKRPAVDSRQGSLFDDKELLGHDGIVALAEGCREYDSERYRDSRFGEECLRPLLQKDRSAEELVTHLVKLYRAKDDEGLDAALLLLSEVMDTLRTDLERCRPLAERKMELWQIALAHHIFCIDVSPELGAEITRVLLNARIDILPQLHQASTSRMLEMVPPEGYPDIAPELAIEDLLADMDEMGVTSAFEMVDALLQMMAIGHTEVQLVMCEQMFYSDSTLAREAAALMLFHPHEEVRKQVAEFLAGAEGEFFTSVILRRLIVSRNWFPDALRKKLDQAIAHARRARIDCAPLNKPAKVQAYASTVDGANAQSLQIVIPRKRGYLSCSTMPKKGFGMADAFLLELENKKHLQEFLKMLKFEVGGLEVSMDYIDERICQVLADGVRNGKVPNHWLVAIAEELGRDQWKAVPFNLENELERLDVELQKQGLTASSAIAVHKALRKSSSWPKEQLFAVSWFEDDSMVDEKLNKLFQCVEYDDLNAPIDLIINEILESRRAEWLERLVLTTIWLKAAKKPPVPWEQMYYVAAVVAAVDRPLKQIPLMCTIAEHTVGAYLSRLDDSADA